MYRSRRNAVVDTENTSGQDSFLDVVTNIVGILIILVMVVGVRAKHAPVKVVTSDRDQKLAALESESASVESEVRRIEQESDRLDRELALRSRERELVATRLVAGQQAVASRQQQLDEQSREQWKLQNAVFSAQQELDRLTQLAAAATQVEEETVTLENRPTPLGRTVFGKEAHFQLSAGRIVYVPFDELLQRGKGDMQRHRFTQDDLPSRTFDVGPLEGFRLLLTMEGKLAVGAGQVVFSLREAEFIPVSPMLGEELAEALAQRSEFSSRLAGLDPKDTTITVWFYPDSFAQFRSLKKELQSRGFAVAGWPLAEGSYISGSPNGKRSSMQ